MRRARERWAAWDGAVQRGESPSDFLPLLKDETLLALLASGHPEVRRYEVSLVHVELLNRIVRMRRALGAAVAGARHAIDTAEAASEQGVEAAQRSERSVRSHLEIRQDSVDQEPEAAHEASTKARRVRDAVEEVARSERALRDLDAQARLRAEREED